MEARVSGHGVYRTEYHVVWIPEYRRRILNPGVRGYLRKLFQKVMRSLPGCEIIELNMQVDHIHMLLVIPPKYAVSAVVEPVEKVLKQILGRDAEKMTSQNAPQSTIFSLGRVN